MLCSWEKGFCKKAEIEGLYTVTDRLHFLSLSKFAPYEETGLLKKTSKVLFFPTSYEKFQQTKKHILKSHVFLNYKLPVFKQRLYPLASIQSEDVPFPVRVSSLSEPRLSRCFLLNMGCLRCRRAPSFRKLSGCPLLLTGAKVAFLSGCMSCEGDCIAAPKACLLFSADKPSGRSHANALCMEHAEAGSRLKAGCF